jgi:hypothetical protein
MLCKNSWINLSWDGKPARIEKENIRVTFNRRAKTLIDFNQICDQTAKEIYDSHKNLYLAISGGSDSEYVATCLYRNGIPFTPLIINYTSVNTKDQEYELWYAYQWCKKHQIVPTVINVDNYTQSKEEKQDYIQLNPRLFVGAPITCLLHRSVQNLGGYLITGSQLEYYPDHEQMTYLEPQLGNYKGFVMEESDLYLETLSPNFHPWAFFYWSPEIMASFVNSWNETLTMQENKSAIYKTSPRPKFGLPGGVFSDLQYHSRKALANSRWGTLDCALLGNKEHLLSQLLE